MMNRLRHVLMFLALIALSTLSLRAGRDANLEPATPTHWYIGVFGGISVNTHTGMYGLYDDSRPCCTFNSGSGTGLVLGLKAFIPLTDNLFFEPRLSYEGRGGTLVGSQYQQQIRGQNNVVEVATYKDELEATMPYLCLDALADYILLPKYQLYVGAGFSMGMIMSKTYTQYENIVAPSDVVYLDGSVRKSVNSSTLPDFQSFQFGIRFGAGANIHLKGKFFISPEVLYTIPLSSYSSNAGTAWKSSHLQPTLGLSMQL